MPKQTPLLRSSNGQVGSRINSPEGRKRESSRNQRGQITAKQGWCLITLLVLPTVAIGKAATTLPLWITIAWIAGISQVTWFVMRSDKRCAIANGRRTPEATLHMLELLGGWPASFLAQRFHRHKIVKVSYQFAYWCIVALHQAVAADHVLGWKSVIFLRRLFDR